MRKLTVFLFFLLATCMSGQTFICKDGVTKFTSEAPLELIKAQSSKTNGVIDVTTKNFAFSVDIDSFEGFNSALQKEHFREDYMETEKFPKAVFKGKLIEDVDFTKNGVVNVRAKGNFKVHGIEKEKLVKVKITIKDKTVKVETSFDVPLDDHNIKIPKVVNQKIASVIKVEVEATLKPKA